MQMSFSELLDWQWQDYADTHRNRNNLLIHLLTVPLFMLGALHFVYALLFQGLIIALGGFVLMAIALFAQARGNELEVVQRIGYDDAWDFARRVAAEQFITFPRFVLSGEWYRNFRRS